MYISYYLAGLLTGVSATSFFIGKELYRYYVKNKIQKKQLERMEKLNTKMRNSFTMEVNEN